MIRYHGKLRAVGSTASVCSALPFSGNADAACFAFYAHDVPDQEDKNLLD